MGRSGLFMFLFFKYINNDFHYQLDVIRLGW